jgi:hypothetical protein
MFLFLFGGLLLLHFYEWPLYKLDFWKIIASVAILILLVAWYADYLHSCKILEIKDSQLIVKTPILNITREYKYSDIETFDKKTHVSRVAKLSVSITSYPKYLIIFNDGVEVKLSPNMYRNHTEMLKYLTSKLNNGC